MASKQHTYTAIEVDYLKANHKIKTIQQLADHLGLGYNSVRGKLQSLGIKACAALTKKLSKKDKKVASRPSKYDALHQMQNFKPTKPVKDTTTGKIPLKINDKLTIYIRPDQDPEVIKAKYR